MNLVLGKFTTENFSRFSKAFSTVEIDLIQYLSWDERDRRRFRAWIQKKQIQVIPKLSLRIQRNREEYRDLFLAIPDEFGDRVQFFMISSGRKRFDPGMDLFSHREFRAAAPEYPSGFWFEWGEEDTHETLHFVRAGYSPVGMVMDLDYHWKYHGSQTLPCHFKLHGWHPDRWMRRYGDTLIRKYRKRMELHPDSLLILAHSGRIEEASEFG